MSKSDRFLDLFISLEKELKKQNSERKSSKQNETFRALAERYVGTKPGIFKIQDFQEIARIRNFIMHEGGIKKGLIVPTDVLLKKMEKILSTLEESVIKSNFKDVVTVGAEDSLADIMRKIKDLEFTQFPAYQNDEFIGLLTENGIVRWLSNHITKQEISIIELEDVRVEDVLKREEESTNFEFFAKEQPLVDARLCFRSNPMLDAIIITESGEQNQKPLGIITGYDIKQTG